MKFVFFCEISHVDFFIDQITLMELGIIIEKYTYLQERNLKALQSRFCNEVVTNDLSWPNRKGGLWLF